MNKIAIRAVGLAKEYPVWEFDKYDPRSARNWSSQGHNGLSLSCIARDFRS